MGLGMRLKLMSNVPRNTITIAKKTYTILIVIVNKIATYSVVFVELF